MLCCLILPLAHAQPHKGDWLIDGKASMGTGGFNYIRPFDLIKFSVIPNGTYFITNRLAATVTRASLYAAYSDSKPTYSYTLDAGLRFYYGKKTARFAPFLGTSYQFRENRPWLYFGANYYLTKDFALEFNLGTYESEGYAIGNFGFKTVLSKQNNANSAALSRESSEPIEPKIQKGDVLLGLSAAVGNDRHRLNVTNKFGVMTNSRLMLGILTNLEFWEERHPLYEKNTSIDLDLGGFIRYYPFNIAAQNVVFVEATMQHSLSYTIIDSDYTRLYSGDDKVFSFTRWGLGQTLGINRFITPHIALEGGLAVFWPKWFELTPDVNINLGMQVFLHPCNCRN